MINGKAGVAEEEQIEDNGIDAGEIRKLINLQFKKVFLENNGTDLSDHNTVSPFPQSPSRFLPIPLPPSPPTYLPLPLFRFL